jgi:hypothetical protein
MLPCWWASMVQNRRKVSAAMRGPNCVVEIQLGLGQLGPVPRGLEI